MKFNDLTITFHTDKIRDCVDFYSKYFKTAVAFDAEWYVMIRLESDKPMVLNFQQRNKDLDYSTCSQFGGGVTLNLLVEDVDARYNELDATDIVFAEKITDHEWGDRAFSLYDPIGNLIYIYSERPLHEKFKSAVKE
ncbi:MAG: hypothetical protein PHV24_07670 [Candidatus Kapabacteria bacterium]|nr:hypothetical protein [Candidatus Kapabacteria bacterium]